MKRTKTLLIIAVLLLVCVLAATLVACNGVSQPSGSSTTDLRAYAGKYYEQSGGRLKADSWIELRADGTWTDDEGTNGKYSVSGNRISLSGDGMTFDGTVQSGTLSVEFFGLVTVYKQGTPSVDPVETAKYSVSFILDPDDEYDEEQLDAQSYEAGEVMGDLPIPERDGYNFVEWEGSDGRKYTRASVMPAENLILTARWEKKVSTYEDEYVTFKPAAQGKKHESNWYMAYSGYGIDNYVYVELTSDDLGGMSNVGSPNNFRLSELEFSVKSGYQWTWYSDDFNTINGTQRFTLRYGSNIQFVTAQDGSGNVQAIYLVDIYVLHDYKIELYKNTYERGTAATPYDSFYVVEGNRIPDDKQKTLPYTGYAYTPDTFVYYNETSGQFAQFGIDEMIYDDYALYQTYKPYSPSYELDKGSMAGELSLTPFEQYQQLEIPTREGYDFIGWKMSNGKYFADITGFSATNYYSPEVGRLTAEWRPQQLFAVWEGDFVTFCKTVPYVTYLDGAHDTILEVVYSPVGYDCSLPTMVDEHSYFSSWEEYKYDEGQEKYSVARVKFGGELTSPRAMHAVTVGDDFGDELYSRGIPLNSMRSFSNNSVSSYRVNLPLGCGDPDGYVLRVEGNIKITRDSFGSGYDYQAAQTYTVSGSQDIPLSSKGAAVNGYSFTVSNASGSFKLGLYGPTATTAGEPFDGTSIASGDKLVAEEDEDWCAWLLDGEKVSEGTSRELPVSADMLGKTYEKRYGHEFGDWIEDSPASCTAKGHHHKECEVCGYHMVEEDIEMLPHSWNEDTNKCDVCGADKPYEERDGKIYFGEYPQTKVEDNGIISTLNGMSGDRPSKGNSGKWTDYGYYISGKVEEYMWYIDLEYGGERYRGVYFTSYRPYYTTYSSSNSDQDDNGYYTNTLYWFKWEPIEWRVLERTDGEAFLMSNVILDSQQYYRTTSGTRNIDGKTIYPNNYKESDIRAWLNGTFYNQAFDEFEQAIIKETLVDNSASTTASSSNSYACENTNDKVFLLSYQDVFNTKYGFNSSSSNYDTARQLKTTGYAQSQGAYTSTDSSYRGNGWWWLRSPYDYYSYNALYVRYSGDAGDDRNVDYSSGGIVPALKITL